METMETNGLSMALFPAGHGIGWGSRSSAEGSIPVQTGTLVFEMQLKILAPVWG